MCSTIRAIQTEPSSPGSLDSQPPMLPFPDVRQIPMDGLELGGLLGSGGMGQVYRASLKGKPVAIKFLSQNFRLEAPNETRFRREHQSLSLLKHPCIVDVYEISRDGTFFAMELLDGPNLQDWRNSLQSAPAPELIAKLMLQIASAMEYAHRQGVIHRDLKPRNVILVEQTSASPTPKVIDFGIAAVEDATQLTSTGEAVGSPRYLPPECLTEASDLHKMPAVDIYGLGGLMYFLLCGRAPFDDQASTQIDLLQTLKNPYAFPNPPRHISRQARSLENICMRCLHRNPRQRYHSAGEVVAELSRYLAGESVLAVPDSLTQRMLRTVRRHAKPITISLASFACAVTMALFWNEARKGKAVATKTVSSLLEVLDTQAEIIGSSEILQNPDNHRLCEALFRGYRASHHALDLSRVGERDALVHATQLQGIARVALEIGQLGTAQEFLDFFDAVVAAYHESGRSQSEAWSTLQFQSRVLRAEWLLLSDQPHKAICAARETLGHLESHTESGDGFSRIAADLLKVCGRAGYVKYKRDFGMLETADYCLQEVALRRELFLQSKTDEDALALAQSLGRLGLTVYKSGKLLACSRTAGQG